MVILCFKTNEFMELNANYWDTRYQECQIGWDLGQVSPPIKEYCDQLVDKTIKILIPGAGNAYEAEYLFNQGFSNVFIVDFAQTALDGFSERNPTFPKEQLLCSDFFELNDTFDLILEQTFFCAIDPSLRLKYVQKMSALLRGNGRLVGVMFNRDFDGGPPFGGNKEEYVSLFNPYFSEISFEECCNSITPRKGSELFVKCLK